jgi:hypothetical protein
MRISNRVQGKMNEMNLSHRATQAGDGQVSTSTMTQVAITGPVAFSASGRALLVNVSPLMIVST